LVAGYNVEYSSMGFALFFLGEYGNILLIRRITTILFLGGWLPPFYFLPFTWIPGSLWFGIKVCFFVAAFVWARAAYPRYRYDQLIRLGWKVFLPFSLGWLLFTGGVLIRFNWLP
jgi:NADH-quinone oxidoreductase subunit H